MNTLEIIKEITQITFTYSAAPYEFSGSCNLTVEKKIKDINAQVNMLVNAVQISVGNCSSNGSTNVNIYNDEYRGKIDEVAHYFVQLQEALDKKYITTEINSEV